MLEKIEQEIKKILEIVKLCPPNLQEKCFELLFNLAINNDSGKKIVTKDKIDIKEGKENDQEPKDTKESSLKLPGNVLAFLRKNNISQVDLGKLFILDHEPILPTYKIKGGTTAQSQLNKVFMILLENGILKNQFKATYAELRDTCKEEGLFDSNFTTMLKRKHTFFKGAIKKDTIDENGEVELTGIGTEEMANIVKSLCEFK